MVHIEAVLTPNQSPVWPAKIFQGLLTQWSASAVCPSLSDINRPLVQKNHIKSSSLLGYFDCFQSNHTVGGCNINVSGLSQIRREIICFASNVSIFLLYFCLYVGSKCKILINFTNLQRIVCTTPCVILSLILTFGSSSSQRWPSTQHTKGFIWVNRRYFGKLHRVLAETHKMWQCFSSLRLFWQLFCARFPLFALLTKLTVQFRFQFRFVYFTQESLRPSLRPSGGDIPVPVRSPKSSTVERG